MKIFVLISFLSYFFFAGCEATHQAAQEIGKPVGAITKTVGGVTEGAVEAYVGEEEDNPYKR